MLCQKRGHKGAKKRIKYKIFVSWMGDEGRNSGLEGWLKGRQELSPGWDLARAAVPSVVRWQPARGSSRRFHCPCPHPGPKSSWLGGHYNGSSLVLRAEALLVLIYSLWHQPIVQRLVHITAWPRDLCRHRHGQIRVSRVGLEGGREDVERPGSRDEIRPGDS